MCLQFLTLGAIEEKNVEVLSFKSILIITQYLEAILYSFIVCSINS